MSKPVTQRASKGRYYVDNQKLLQALIDHKDRVKLAKEQNREKPRLPEYVGECILKIATHLTTRPNFSGYSYRDEMIADAIENCLLYLDNFDPSRSSSPFSYITQICWYASIRRIQKEKKAQYVKYKVIQMAQFTGGMSTIDDASDIQQFGDAGSDLGDIAEDNIGRFIDDYEKSLVRKKEEKSKKPKGLELFIEEDS